MSSRSLFALGAVVLTLPVSAANLVTNGSFDGDIASWYVGGQGLEAKFRCDAGSTLANGSGPGALELRLTGTSTSACVYRDIAISPSSTVEMTASAYVPGAGNGAEKVFINFQWTDATFTYVGTGYAFERSSPPKDEWLLLSGTGTAPADAASAKIGLCLRTDSTVNPATAYFDDVLLVLKGSPDGLAQELFLPVASSKAGKKGTYWRTDLWAQNRTGATVTLLGSVLAPGGDNTAEVAAPATLGTIPPYGAVAITDAVGDLGRSLTGALYLRAEGAGAAPLVSIMSRNWTPEPEGAGSYGQGVEAVGRGTASPTYVQGLFEGADFRTNLGALNTSGEFITITVRVVNAAGTTVATRAWNLAPYQPILESLSSDLGVSSLDGGTAKFSMTSYEGSFRAFASVADNHSGDSILIAAQP